MPCSKCKVTKHHLQNHGGKEHSINNCRNETEPKDYKFYHDSLQEVTRHTNFKQRCDDMNAVDTDDQSECLVQTLNDRRKEAKNFGNVISLVLLQFEDLDDLVEPLMHVLMGLTNDNLNAIKKDCQNLDKKNVVGKDPRDVLIEGLYERLSEKQSLQNHYNECSRELKLMREDILPLIVENKVKEALIVATAAHKVTLTKANKKKKRELCSSSFCLLFPIDVQQGYDRTIQCRYACQPHTLCEGVHDFSEEVTNEEMEYVCNKCKQLAPEQIDEKFLTENGKLEKESEKLFLQCNDIMMNISCMQQEKEKVMGRKEMKYYEGLKKLKTEEGSYHGGDLNGKDCNKILLDAHAAKSVNECVALECIAADLPEKAEGYLELFKILANVWQTLRHPPASGLYDDEDLEEVISFCTSWSKRLPILFPERNITRKGHVLSFHIPEYLKKYRTYYQYYALEQAGESIHAKMNKLMRRFSPMRPKEERLWKIVEEYERQNGINKESIQARKRKPNLPFIAKASLAQLAVLSIICIALIPIGL
jgi:hypothetical protein